MIAIRLLSIGRIAVDIVIGCSLIISIAVGIIIPICILCTVGLLPILRPAVSIIPTIVVLHSLLPFAPFVPPSLTLERMLDVNA